MLKDKLLDCLEAHRDTFLSGEALATQLGVTRAAVWKAIGQLKEEGLEIEAVTRRGYRLAAGSERLRAETIRAALPPEFRDLTIEVYDCVTSTNAVAKQRALDGAPGGTLIVAAQQTAGRGRRGRTFYSPPQSGVYTSLLLRPQCSVELSLRMTVAAAVAVCEGIEQLTDKQPQIKWVNDVFVDGKKVCGILTEAVSDYESNTLESAVIGFGLNVKPSTMPPELRDVAGAIGDETLSSNALVGAVTGRLLRWCGDLSSSALMDAYRKRSMVLGREVTFMERGTQQCGKAVAINEDGNLVVQLPVGTERVLTAGEISLSSQQFVKGGAQ